MKKFFINIYFLSLTVLCTTTHFTAHAADNQQSFKDLKEATTRIAPQLKDKIKQVCDNPIDKINLKLCLNKHADAIFKLTLLDESMLANLPQQNTKKTHNFSQKVDALCKIIEKHIGTINTLFDENAGSPLEQQITTTIKKHLAVHFTEENIKNFISAHFCEAAITDLTKVLNSSIIPAIIEHRMEFIKIILGNLTTEESSALTKLVESFN